ncbi:MAG: (2Fe-2S)-binding protein [Chloroflexi bacterium]|nr:(2Fe-2S)-binding protein [Chloroflexota bacterium]
MPKLTVDDRTADVPDGQRLVLAIEAQGVNIGHRCGGFARCTTCRVEFLDGEPDTMTDAEYAVLKTRDLLSQYRLSCQIVCDHDMSVRPGMTRESAGWDDTGPTPEPTVTPEAAWYPKEELERRGSA